MGRNGSAAGALAVLGAAAALGIASPPLAHAAGGRYVFDGGNGREQATVRAALEASAFAWSVVPNQIVIHIRRGVASTAVPGEISLDADLLDAGRFAWGVVQHEYAHQVDFFLLDAERRAELASALGGRAWWQDAAALPHDQLTGERFASTLAWAYWPSQANVMRPTSPADEAAAMPPAEFRLLLERVLGAQLSSPSIARFLSSAALSTKGNVR